MNRNSHVCRFMAEHNDWRGLLAEKGIGIKEEGELAILNYGILCDFTDPVVQEARGIIINTESLDVVCWPFRKFGNHGEGYADDIDWSTACVQEKVDGSITKLWHDHRKNIWRWSTNSMIDASEAHTMDGAVSFMELIRRAENHKDIPYDGLDRDMTYIFELVAPEQKIVIRYDRPYLFHTGTRNNITGQESNVDIGIKKPTEYPLHSLAECVHAAEELNAGGDTVRFEGYVVVDADWHRLKVKSPEYVYMHRVATGHVFTKRRLLPMIRGNEGNLEELLATAPDSEVYVRFYQWRYAEFKKNVRIAVSRARAMFEELEHDRRAMAERLKEDPYQTFCFKALGNNRTAEEIIEGMKDSTVGRFIEEYGSFTGHSSSDGD